MCLIKTRRGWVQLGDAVRALPAVDVYRPMTAEEAAEVTTLRAMAYERNVVRHINGVIGEHEIYTCWKEPLFGSYGEKL